MPQPAAGIRNHGNPAPVMSQIIAKKALVANQTAAWTWNERWAPVISLRVRRSGPRGERDVQHTHALLEAVPTLELGEAGLDRGLVADHPGPVGHGHEQRPDVE